MTSQKRSRDDPFPNEEENEDVRKMRQLHEARLLASAAKRSVDVSAYYNANPDITSSSPTVQQKDSASNVFAFSHPIVEEPLNMALQNTESSNKLMVKACVKTKLFSRLKFFKKEIHGLYDLRPNSVCALIIANCNVTPEQADKYWWGDMRKVVINTHTDRRNNVIKNIRLRFWDGISGKIPFFKTPTGTESDMNYLFAMRENMVHYVHLIDIYAPCIVGRSNWNNTTNMVRFCGQNQKLFNDNVFSVSDEAFLLLVLDNYTESWLSEVDLVAATLHNSVHVDSMIPNNRREKVKPKYTLSRNQRHDSNGVAGIGWTEEGFAKFNELYDRVVEDRKNRGAAFNQELLNVITERQRGKRQKLQGRAKLGKQKTIPKDDMGNLGGFPDDDDENGGDIKADKVTSI